MVITLNVQHGALKQQQEQTLNEVGTLLTGAGTEVLESIGATHFDRYTWLYQNSRSGTDAAGGAVPAPLLPYCGRLTASEVNRLSDPGGETQCADFTTCPYIEGFAGLSTVITRGDFDYEVTVDAVEYVLPTDFSVVAPGETFAKRVTITVENPYLYLGDDPSNTFSLTLQRVFTYGCVTDSNLIPYVRQNETCPPMPCARWF